MLVIAGIVQLLTIFVASLVGQDDLAFFDLLFDRRFQLINAFGIALFVLHLVAAWLVWRLVKKCSRAVLNTTGVIVLVYWLLGMSLFNGIVPNSAGLLGFWSRVGVLLFVGFLTYVGLGALLAWTIRRSVKELTSLAPMISRFLPLLLITVLFFFFNTEIWQLAFTLPVVRVWAITAVIIGLTLVLIVANKTDEMRRLLRRQPLDDIDLLDRAPFPVEMVPEAYPPFTFRERLNLVFIPVLVQFIQMLLFSVLLLGFFIVFGALSIHDDLVKLWTGQPTIPVEFFGMKLPVDLTLAKVSLILAAFSGLTFAASTETDARYEAVFGQPIFEEMRMNLAARAAYKNSILVDPEGKFDPVALIRTQVEDTRTVLTGRTVWGTGSRADDGGERESAESPTGVKPSTDTTIDSDTTPGTHD